MNFTEAEGYIEIPPDVSFDSHINCICLVTVYLGYGVEIQVSIFIWRIYDMQIRTSISKYVIFSQGHQRFVLISLALLLNRYRMPPECSKINKYIYIYWGLLQFNFYNQYVVSIISHLQFTTVKMLLYTKRYVFFLKGALRKRFKIFGVPKMSIIKITYKSTRSITSVPHTAFIDIHKNIKYGTSDMQFARHFIHFSI